MTKFPKVPYFKGMKLGKLLKNKLYKFRRIYYRGWDSEVCTKK